MSDKHRFVMSAFVSSMLALAALLWSGGVSLAHGDEEHGRGGAWLGVVMTAGDAGVEIAEVIKDSPADRAGLRRGDRIVAVEGRDVTEVRDVVEAVRSRKAGEILVLTLSGDNEERREVTATLEEPRGGAMLRGLFGHVPPAGLLERLDGGLPGLESLDELLEGGPGLDGTGSWTIDAEPGGYLGVTPIQPSDGVRRALGGVDGVGVLVNEVAPDSPADRAGLLAGDLIVGVGEEKIESVRQLRKTIRGREPESVVRIDVVRDRGERTLDVTLGTSGKEIRMFRMLGPDDVGEGRLELDLEGLETLPRLLREESGGRDGNRHGAGSVRGAADSSRGAGWQPVRLTVPGRGPARL